MLRTLQALAFTALWVGALFLAAGRLDWIRGWIYVAAYLACIGAVAFAARRYNPEIFEARAKVHRKDTKPFDKIILSVYFPLLLLQLPVAGLEVVRFHRPPLPVWTVYAGIVMLAFASGMLAWVMIVNRFAEPTVRIQTDRGHTVVTAGPYRFVRHPMYVGMTLMFLAAPLILGSVWALGIGGILAALLVLRTALEDGTLRRELPGYEEFTTRTRYRLAPGIW